MSLGRTDDTPDHSTISRFRKALAERGLGERMFAEVIRQLDVRRLLLKHGTLLDATREGTGGASESAEGLGAPSTADPDTVRTTKGDSASFGFETHLGADGKSGLIRKEPLTPK